MNYRVAPNYSSLHILFLIFWICKDNDDFTNLEEEVEGVSMFHWETSEEKLK